MTDVSASTPSVGPKTFPPGVAPPWAVPAPEVARGVLAGIASRAVLADDRLVAETWATVAWNLLAEPGDGVAGRLVAHTDPVTALGVLDERDGAGEGIGRRDLDAGLARWRPRLSTLDVAATLASARRCGVRLVTRADAEWPRGVEDLGDHQPLCLWALGDPTRLRDLSPAVAIVGARAATGYGEHVAMELAAGLAASGVTVVSGAAYGIDGAAHRAALAAGGLTVALLAGGLDRPYPAGHAQLIDRISASGVALSEVPCGGAPTKWRFLARNRLIAALADATVVVEAGRRSGSLNTAGHAAQLGRPLGAVPGPVTSGTSAGCHRLLREYDAQCITSTDDVRELLGLGDDRNPLADESAVTPGAADRSRVLDAVSRRATRPTSDIARRAGMSEHEVTATLGLLALEGAVAAGSGGWRRA